MSSQKSGFDLASELVKEKYEQDEEIKDDQAKSEGDLQSDEDALAGQLSARSSGAESNASSALAQVSNVHTTAGGDGLSFVPGMPNIFDMIDVIKMGREEALYAKLTGQTLATESSIDDSRSMRDDESESEEKSENSYEGPDHNMQKFLNDIEIEEMDDLPPSLKPISGIFEVIRHMEALKEGLKPLD